MFIRKVTSRHSTCFQIGEKRYGRFYLIKHIGCAQTPTKVESLRLKAQQELHKLLHWHQLPLLPNQSLTLPTAKVRDWHITGYHQVFGSIYDRIGFPQTLLRDLVITRIVYPKSKAATLRYLQSHLGISLPKDRLYRFLDTLDKKTLTDIAFRYVCLAHPQGLTVCFYDVTTLYFETTREDEFKQKGFSKDHRQDMPQIVIGLFVDQRGYPFDLEWFEGKTFEGHTFIQAIEAIKSRYHLVRLTVIADAGMLSADNIGYLQTRQINYIVGARLKNLSATVTAQFLTHSYPNQPFFQTVYGNQRLLVDYSEARAKQSRKNRLRLLNKLSQQLEKKQSPIKRSKYLAVSGKQRVMGIDETKITYDQQFDGLKGYFTNQDNPSSAEEIVKRYHELWQVEKAFRMSKHDLQERPIYHSVPQRIKSHLLICFVALLVMKETEQELKQIPVTLEQVLELLAHVGQGKVRVGTLMLDAESELDETTQTILNHFLGH